MTTLKMQDHAVHFIQSALVAGGQNPIFGKNGELSAVKGYLPPKCSGDTSLVGEPKSQIVQNKGFICTGFL